MLRADELDREVNRLYWETTEPVTRLAAQLDVSRGTFYNHLRPLPAGANCSTCGGRLLFRTRSSRDAGQAHCGECEGEETLGRSGAGTGAPAARKPRPTAAAGKEATASATPKTRQGAGARKQTSASASPPKPKGPLSGQASPVARPKTLSDDDRRTQLLIIAVGAAVLGLGFLYYSRHRS